MSRLLTFAILLLAATAQAEPIKVFIFAGQSNAGGNVNYDWQTNAVLSSDTEVSYPRPSPLNLPCLFIKNGDGLADCIANGWGLYFNQSPFKRWTWNNATNNYAYDANGNHVYSEYVRDDGYCGLEWSFMLNWRADNPTGQVAIIKVVLGGSSIGDWSPPNGNMWNILKTHLDQAKARFAAADLQPQWEAMVWMQGENGWAHAHPADGFAVKTRAFLAAVRAETSPAMKCVVGKIGDNMLADAVLQPYTNAKFTLEMARACAEFRRADQQDIGEDDGNAWWSNDLLPIGAGQHPSYSYHYSPSGYLAMGERAYAAYSGAAPPAPPLVPTLAYMLTIDGQPVQLNPGDKLEFVLAGNELKPKLTVGGAAVPANVPYSLDAHAEALAP